jgi:hypothetical protein
MDAQPDGIEFIKHLREEKLAAQQTRSSYTQRKLAYGTMLFSLGLGSTRVAQLDLKPLLYLVPFVATAFDLYILAEDYSVKRIGAFLGARTVEALEKDWEAWVSRNRDPFAPVAMPILSTLLLVGSALTIWTSSPQHVTRVFWVWLVMAGLPSWVLFAVYRRLRNRIPRQIEVP